MIYDEALQVLEQVKEVFKQMNEELNQCKADLKLLEMLSKSLG